MCLLFSNLCCHWLYLRIITFCLPPSLPEVLLVFSSLMLVPPLWCCWCLAAAGVMLSLALPLGTPGKWIPLLYLWLSGLWALLPVCQSGCCLYAAHGFSGAVGSGWELWAPPLLFTRFLLLGVVQSTYPQMDCYVELSGNLLFWTERLCFTSCRLKGKTKVHLCYNDNDVTPKISLPSCSHPLSCLPSLTSWLL